MRSARDLEMKGHCSMGTHHPARAHQPSPHIQAVIAIMGHCPLDNAQPKYDVLRSKIKILYMYFISLTVS